MSGGHYNYQCHSLSNLLADIRADVAKYSQNHKDKYGIENEALPVDVLQAMKTVADKLEELGKAAHDIEWLMSGDYGEDTFRNCLSDWAEWILKEET